MNKLSESLGMCIKALERGVPFKIGGVEHPVLFELKDIHAALILLESKPAHNGANNCDKDKEFGCNNHCSSCHLPMVDCECERE